MTDLIQQHGSAAHAVPHLTVDERLRLGKEARARASRSSQAEFRPATNRPDPVSLLERQATTRVPELVPISYGRMLVSPFTLPQGLTKCVGVCASPGPRTRPLGRPRRNRRLSRAPTDVRPGPCEFAVTYTDQNQRDYEGIRHAASTGRITVESGLQFHGAHLRDWNTWTPQRPMSSVFWHGLPKRSTHHDRRGAVPTAL